MLNGTQEEETEDLSPEREEVWEPPSMEEIAAHRRDFPKIQINVGGVKHEVMWRVLEARPLTRLGMLGRNMTRSIQT